MTVREPELLNPGRGIQTENIEGAGIAIGHGASVRIYGNVYYHPVKLRAALSRQFDPLLREYRRLFAGREKELAFIAERVVNSQSGYLVVSGPAGFGKTALMAALIQATPEAFAYHFFNPANVPYSIHEIHFLRNVVQQISQWREHHGELVPDRLDELNALYNQMMSMEMEGTRILVLDGIDEVSAWPIQNYLPHPLPRGLHVIVTLRDVGQNWREEYGFRPEETDHLALDGLSSEDIVELLRTAGGAAAKTAENKTSLAELLRVAAYPARESLGADPFYVRLLAEDLAAGRLRPADIGKQSRGLNRYLDGWWKAIKRLAGDQPAKDLFGTLAAAQGPIFRADLEAINSSLVDDWEVDFFDEVIVGVRRFVSTDEQSGYTLAHPRLQRYLRWRLKVDRYEDKLLAYCTDWPEHRSPYALANFARHLAESGQKTALFALVDPSWMAAKQEAFHSHRSFAEDLKLIAEQAAAEPRLDVVPHLLHACLVYNELVIDVPVATLELLAQIGQGQRALDYAALIADIADRAEAYRLIGRALAANGESNKAKMAFQFAYRALQKVSPEIESRELLLRLNSDVDTVGFAVYGAVEPLPVSEEKAYHEENTLLDYFPAELQAADPGVDLIIDKLAVSIDWRYPAGQESILHDLSRLAVQAGETDYLWTLPESAPGGIIRAWMFAQLAVGAARAGDDIAAAYGAQNALRILKEGSASAEAGAAVSAEAHWLTTPAMIAVAQSLALAGEKEPAGELADEVLAATKAAGYEVGKTSALTAISWALWRVKQQEKAAAAADAALSTAETFLQEEDLALACYELLHLFITLNKLQPAARAAALILPYVGFLDEQQLVSGLSRSAQALAATSSPQETAPIIRDAAEWDYDMDSAEIAELVGSVALWLAENGEADLAVALASKEITPWRDTQLLNEIVLALTRRGHRTDAEAIVRNLACRDLEKSLLDDEESSFVLRNLVEALVAEGEPALARSAAEAIAFTEERAQALALVRETAHSSEEELDQETYGGAQAEDETPLHAQDEAAILLCFNEQLMGNGMPDRPLLFETIEASANDLAGLDQGVMLGHLVDIIQSVDQWWGRT